MATNQELPHEGEMQIALFTDREIRKVFHEEQWHFSVIDVVAALADTTNPRRYWSDLKAKLGREAGLDQLYDEIVQLPLEGPDGKLYATDAATTEVLLRIVQSIPSPKAEPFKRWLARVGTERLQEIENPGQAIERAILTYKAQGRDDKWIEARMRSVAIRNTVTREWSSRGVREPREYAILTNTVAEETFEISIKEHKARKQLPARANLRDHMTDVELVLTMLGEASTVSIAQQRDAQGFVENKQAATDGGRVAGNARRDLEKQLGTAVVSPTGLGDPAEPQRRLQPPPL